MKKNLLQEIKSHIILYLVRCKYVFLCWYWYAKERRHCQVPPGLLRQECQKYMKCMWHLNHRKNILTQWKALLTSSFRLISDRLEEQETPDTPLVFVVERNELARMKVFFSHYRRMGVEQFIVLDNGSDDGTLEWLVQQKGTKVYQVLDAFQTQKKTGWIEKLLLLDGRDRWCAALDADELLDFVGSETHTLTDLVRAASSKGYKRIEGVLLDMYAQEPLFHTGEDFIRELRFFDKDSYKILRSENSEAPVQETVYGGPRDRVLGGERALSKQAVFLFTQDSLYLNCHFLYPFISGKEFPCWYVLRHYKFLRADKAEYVRRAHEKCFYKNSVEYQFVESQEQAICFYDENSQEYQDSRSLACLPFLHKIPW